MPMEGKDAHLRRLKKLQQVSTVASKVLYVGADMIRAEAHRSISAGSVSGKNHTPSAPGTPPNRNTGTLQAGLEVARPEPLVTEVQSNAPYAAVHEFGGSKHPKRAYLRPARDKMAPRIQELFEQELSEHVRRSGSK